MHAGDFRQVKTLRPQGHVAEHLKLARSEVVQELAAVGYCRRAVCRRRRNASGLERVSQQVSAVNADREGDRLTAIGVLLVALDHQVKAVACLKHIRQLLGRKVSVGSAALRADVSQGDARLNRKPARRCKEALLDKLFDSKVR